MGFFRQIKVHKLQMKCCRLEWDLAIPYYVSSKTVAVTLPCF